MKFNFILKSGLILSFVGIIIFMSKYALGSNLNPTMLFIFRIVAAILIILLLIRQYVLKEVNLNGPPNFFMYLANFVLILFLSTTINLLVEYTIYNHVNTAYKYEIEEIEYQGISSHRAKKGLPMPYKISNQEIEYKYGLIGLLTYYKTGYILNIMVIIIFYLFAALFYKIKTDS